ncbi:MAG TPA: c-type cytochrome [Steroidobacteraceae bacterium]|nr:c-type cytochrome [Steroidobacteraceae bacterium]
MGPLNYTVAFGTKGYPVVHLLWALIILSLIVVAAITVLTLAGILRRLRERRDATDAHLRSDAINLVPLERGGRGLSLVYIGTGISAALLLATAIWTFFTLDAVSIRPQQPAPPMTIDIIAHQWWWEVRYESSSPAQQFVTANEIHIPTGVRVYFKLHSDDVIHSFWVPQLTGKTDVIPGYENVTWLEADRPGTYRGQCGEYCGLQHAHMAFAVVAQEPAQFAAWKAQQLQPAAPPDSALAAQGQQDFQVHCGICHRVRGTTADGILGPDLTHLMSRASIGADTLPNTPGDLSGWIADPQHIKPGNLMPAVALSGSQLTDIRSYLETLE